ncbi:MAG: DUF4352 domain-containing protein [Bryobacteraceae bacterium]
MMKRGPLPSLLLLFSAVAVLTVTGCKKQTSTQINYQMGERIVAGPMVYNVVQTVWRTQLGDMFQLRTPENRYLVITLSATNSGGKEVSMPFLTLEGTGGKEFAELQDGGGVERWFGMLRTIQPAETRQGNVVFDVPLTSYRLRLTDGGELGTEKNVWVEIPLRMDTDTSITSPAPGQQQ